MATRDKVTIKANIIQDVPDNNAGLVSAKDIRDNMVDTVESINQIVASGDVDSTFPFTGSDVRAAFKDASVEPKEYGRFIPESGVYFPNDPNGAATQIMAFRGPKGILHSDLGGLGGNDHAQYLNVTGIQVESHMKGGLGMDSTNWLGVSGFDNRGIRFNFVDDNRDDIHIGFSGQIVFDDDGSRFVSSKGVAKAWINFKGSGTELETPLAATPGWKTPVVNSSYNVSGINYIGRGKYKITFVSGVLQDNNYVAVGNSNSITQATEATEFDVNTVGMVVREGDDLNTLRTLTFYVKSDDNEYVDAALNDLIVYGLGSGTMVDPAVTINPA